MTLSARLGGQGGTFALPTEAQWEYACRAGSTTRYGFGDDEAKLGEYAWYAANSDGKPHLLGLKKPNASGLYDMHGNVGEWCQDWYGESYYEESSADDPAGPAGGSKHTLRGGGWHLPAGVCRSASRFADEPQARGNVMGFRVALDSSGP